MNKKTISILGVVLIIVIILVTGILNGWFRSREKLTTDQVAALSALTRSEIANQDQAEQLFSRLWLEHVSLTREVIVAEFGADASLDAKVAALLQNQKDIAQAVDTYYPGSYQIVADLLTEHIVIAKDILDDLKDLRLARLSPDINKWYVNADLFSEAMQTINGNWDLKDHMHMHLRVTTREAIYEWLGLGGWSLNIYEGKIKPQAQDIAIMMSSQL